jgi:hypothetical protein
MSRTKTYKIKRGSLFYREKKEFKTVFHEVIWIVSMKLKGFNIEKSA